MKGFTVLLIALLLAPLSDAYALKSYRCNGKIQRKPCVAAYAKVLRSEFSELPEREGIWRGAVAGNGTVHLRLVIKKRGIIQSTRYMGNVDLVDKSTTFAFKSVTPIGRDWSWDIVAYNG